MKKIISKLVITIIFLTFPFVVTATDGYDYYYSGGKKVFLKRNPELTRRQICNIIEQSTTKVGDKIYQDTILRPNGTWNEEYGYGLIDAHKALLATPRKEENY